MAKMANSVEQVGAFPTGAPEHGGQVGLSKREYFAVMVMQGLITRHPSDIDFLHNEMAKKAMDVVDALIAELEK